MVLPFLDAQVKTHIDVRPLACYKSVLMYCSKSFTRPSYLELEHFVPYFGLN
jgi:hypothetical protein